ncbi:MAG: glutaredoxin family protein [Steroidobacteraceae bacterium]
MTHGFPVGLAVVSREDCGLCERMFEDLAELAGQLLLPPLATIDLESDPQLLQRFVLEVPVLLLDGDVVCYGHLDRELLKKRLAERRTPG